VGTAVEALGDRAKSFEHVLALLERSFVHVFIVAEPHREPGLWRKPPGHRTVRQQAWYEFVERPFSTADPGGFLLARRALSLGGRKLWRNW